MEHTIEQFQSTYNELLSARSEACDSVKALDSEMQDALRAEYKRLFPRRKWELYKCSQIPSYANIRKPFEDRANKIWDDLSALEKSLSEQLDLIAQDCPMPRIDDLELRYTVYASSYNSQGFGATRYAQNAAEAKADHARYCGLRAEVRPVGEMRYGSYGVSYQDFGVFIDADEIGWEILKRKPRQSLRDWIKSCWARQVNPRVYNPFLPHGLEEKLGLDYFGGEKPCPTHP